MNKKILFGFGLLLIPIGALITACGSAEEVKNAELGLDEATDQFLYPRIPFSEYGLCDDAWDNDGNGLVDMADPACHVLGPVRDLSVYPVGIGNNFAPDITKIPLGGPGMPGGFRDRDQISRWMRFLTGTNGYTAGIDLFGAAIDSPAVPVPVPLFPKILQGTAAQGNNNNIDGVAIPGNAFLPPIGAAAPAVGVAVDAVPAVVGTETAVAAPQANIGESYKPDMFRNMGAGFGHQQRTVNTGDRPNYGAPRSVLDNLGGRSNMWGAGANNQNYPHRQNPQPNAFQNQGGNYGYKNADASGFQSTSMSNSNYGAPSDWPTNNSGYSGSNGLGQGANWQQGGLGRQNSPWGQGNNYGLGNRGGLGSRGNWAQGNNYGFGGGQGQGWPQGGNNYGSQAWPQGGNYGQQAGWPQSGGYGRQGGWPQGNNFGGLGGGLGNRQGFSQRGFGQQGGWPGAR